MRERGAKRKRPINSIDPPAVKDKARESPWFLGGGPREPTGTDAIGDPITPAMKTPMKAG